MKYFDWWIKFDIKDFFSFYSKFSKIWYNNIKENIVEYIWLFPSRLNFRLRKSANFTLEIILKGIWDTIGGIFGIFNN